MANPQAIVRPIPNHVHRDRYRSHVKIFRMVATKYRDSDGTSSSISYLGIQPSCKARGAPIHPCRDLAIGWSKWLVSNNACIAAWHGGAVPNCDTLQGGAISPRVYPARAFAAIIQMPHVQSLGGSYGTSKSTTFNPCQVLPSLGSGICQYLGQPLPQQVQQAKGAHVPASKPAALHSIPLLSNAISQTHTCYWRLTWHCLKMHYQVASVTLVKSSGVTGTGAVMRGQSYANISRWNKPGLPHPDLPAFVSHGTHAPRGPALSATRRSSWNSLMAGQIQFKGARYGHV